MSGAGTIGCLLIKGRVRNSSEGVNLEGREGGKVPPSWRGLERSPTHPSCCEMIHKPTQKKENKNK